MASKICSVETYSSFTRCASSNAVSRILLVAGAKYCCDTPETFGSRAICFSTSLASVVGDAPNFSSSGGTTPSPCASSAQSKCNGSICCWPSRPPISCAACSACWAFTVNLSKFSMAESSHYLTRTAGQQLPTAKRLVRSVSGMLVLTDNKICVSYCQVAVMSLYRFHTHKHFLLYHL